jgi:hypothetical protein
MAELTWEEAQEKLDQEAANYGAKEASLRAVIGCDRRTADIKSVIEQLSLILDPKRVHWTVRVAAVVGRTRPTGQIGEFLGNEVVNALWGEMPSNHDSDSL